MQALKYNMGLDKYNKLLSINHYCHISGVNGTNGRAGDPGTSGAVGIKGQDGVRGPQGQSGDRGNDGPVGFPGKCKCYQVCEHLLYYTIIVKSFIIVKNVYCYYHLVLSLLGPVRRLFTANVSEFCQ